MEASIQEVARLTGTTSRTLRHYDAIGLLEPSRVGDNGYRWYDDRALVRLQRILLLRGLGLGLPEIRRVLEREQDETAALRHHLDWLRSEQRRLERQAASVERTITARENGGPLDGRGHVRRVRPHAVQGRGRAALGRGRVRVVRRLVARDERRRARRVEGDDRAARRRVGARRRRPAPTRRPTRRRSWRGGTSRGSAASRARPGTARRPSRSTCSAWPTCTSPTSGSPRTTAASAGATFVRDALHEYAARNLWSTRGGRCGRPPRVRVVLECDRVTSGGDWTVAQHLPDVAAGADHAMEPRPDPRGGRRRAGARRHPRRTRPGRGRRRTRRHHRRRLGPLPRRQRRGAHRQDAAWRSATAPAPPTRRGRSRRTASSRSTTPRRASTSPARTRPPRRPCRSTRATAGRTRSGGSRPTGRSSACSPACASTSPAAVPPTGPSSGCGPATGRRTRAGPRPCAPPTRPHRRCRATRGSAT